MNTKTTTKTSVLDIQRPSLDLLADKYEVLEPLGGGGMGHVFRARHRQLKRLVAIKLLSQDLADPEAVARFLREARAVARIGSPHVAHVMDADVLPNGQPFIVMEYLQGRDLGAWIASSGRLPLTQAVDFILQALEAIAEAHAQQIVHRDIKPANLFATRTAAGDSMIKVLDFGLAKTSPTFDTLSPGITERGAVLGTPSYMSPEQFMDAQEADVRSDVWALGATLFELLTGTPPFTGGSLPAVYRAVMQRPVPTLRSVIPDLPEELEKVVATCLTREPESRYADVAQLAAALKPWAGAGAAAKAEHIRRILSRPPEPGIEVSVSLDTQKTVAAPGAVSRTIAAGRARSLALMRRPRFMAGSAIVLGLTVVAVISSIMLQGSSSEHPLQARTQVNQQPDIIETHPSNAVDTHTAVAVHPMVVGPVVGVDAGVQPAAAPVLAPTGQAGTDAAPLSSDAPPTRAHNHAPKASRRATPRGAPRRPDPSIYDQYP
ncbi:MAG TPA: serine/threonine-protein kinase [Polyangiales bacterium]|nr:serine/threonine-protein kinase [Polyangiales bacterium]